MKRTISIHGGSGWTSSGPATPKHRYCAALAMIAASLLALGTERAEAQATTHRGFDDFQLVRTRNIFDPNRRAMRTDSSRDSRSTSRITRANTLSLTGTMTTDGRTLAFFSGSRSEYSKVIGVGDTVADFKVKAIAPTQVELEHGGKVTVLTVGKLLTLEGVTEVEVDAATAASTPADPAAPAPTVDPGAEPAPTNDKAEILRRMMERRAKEMNK